jgi:hypothetical protein
MSHLPQPDSARHQRSTADGRHPQRELRRQQKEAA